jgi:hypothetical protein
MIDLDGMNANTLSHSPIMEMIRYACSNSLRLVEMHEAIYSMIAKMKFIIH